MKKRTISILISIFLITLFSGCTSEPSNIFENGSEKDPVIVPRSNYMTVILDFKVTYGDIGLYVTALLKATAAA